MSRQRNQNHQLVAALLVIAMVTLAAIVVIVTRSTAGLLDLAPLLVAISAVVLPLVTGGQRGGGA